MLGVDGRSIWVRRFKDLIEDHVACYGGADQMSEPRMTLLRRTAAQIVKCEQLEALMAEGKETFEDMEMHNRLTGNIRRNYEALGMDRVAKDVMTPMERLEAHRKARREAVIDG
jgi:hypothetical protein